MRQTATARDYSDRLPVLGGGGGEMETIRRYWFFDSEKEVGVVYLPAIGFITICFVFFLATLFPVVEYGCCSDLQTYRSLRTGTARLIGPTLFERFFEILIFVFQLRMRSIVETANISQSASKNSKFSHARWKGKNVFVIKISIDFDGFSSVVL